MNVPQRARPAGRQRVPAGSQKLPELLIRDWRQPATVQTSMILLDVDKKWFAIQVKPRFEKTVAVILVGKGYEQFVPLCRAGERPLFPGYVFCRFDSQVHGPIVTTPGVIRIVAFGNVPASISDADMEAIRTITNTSLPVMPHPYFHLGETIRIKAGPLCGVEGQIVASGKKSLLVVSIHLLQRSIAVEVLPHMLEAMDNREPAQQTQIAGTVRSSISSEAQTSRLNVNRKG